MPDDAEMWLRENDPDYENRGELAAPYLSARQMRRRRAREIPISSLYKLRQRLKMDKHDVRIIKDRVGWHIRD